MTTLLLDTLRLSRALEDKGNFTSEQAEALAEALGEASQGDLATKTDLAGVRTEIAGLKTELKTELAGVGTEIAELRTELKSEIASARGELRSEIAGVGTEIAELRTELNDLEGVIAEQVEIFASPTHRIGRARRDFDSILIETDNFPLASRGSRCYFHESDAFSLVCHDVDPSLCPGKIDIKGRAGWGCGPFLLKISLHDFERERQALRRKNPAAAEPQGARHRRKIKLRVLT